MQDVATELDIADATRVTLLYCGRSQHLRPFAIYPVFVLHNHFTISSHGTSIRYETRSHVPAGSQPSSSDDIVLLLVSYLFAQQASERTFSFILG
jgi:hypothetical protein